VRPEDVFLRVARTGAFETVVGLVERLSRWHRDYLPVLTYHRIDDPAASPLRYPGLISATPRELDRQLAFMAAEMRPIAMEDLLGATMRGARLPRRSIMVTFDDASEDFARTAWPILQRHRIPATLFVPTAYPGEPARRFWWDDLYAALLRSDRPRIEDPSGTGLELGTPGAVRTTFRLLVNQLKAMDHDRAMIVLHEVLDRLRYVPAMDRTVVDWDDLRRFARAGLVLAAHTRSHPLLTRVSAAVAMEELTGSRRDLEREVGAVLPVFAYPSGAWDDVAASLVAAAGYDLAFTTDRGVNHVPTAPRFAFKRINVGHRASRGVVRAQLLPQLRVIPGWTRRRR
jgi:peptidoglycan/xylan/chitin deacetylase (PgdA/CDA1 family)